jgi:predicted enzyme related to lactoylglutathione lyase
MEAMMREDGKLDYLEMPGGGLPAVKAFYADVFGWRFTDYGPEYAAFSEGLDGGFYADAKDVAPAPLPVLFSTDLEATLAKVQAAGAVIIRPITPFPGGRRFHFRDPAGNELAVWAEPSAGD